MATNYLWARGADRRRSRDKAHALSPRMPNELTAQFVCGTRFPADSVVFVAATEDGQCGVCVRHIANGTGWA